MTFARFRFHRNMMSKRGKGIKHEDDRNMEKPKQRYFGESGEWLVPVQDDGHLIRYSDGLVVRELSAVPVMRRDSHGPVVMLSDVIAAVRIAYKRAPPEQRAAFAPLWPLLGCEVPEP